jgi:cytochrome c
MTRNRTDRGVPRKKLRRLHLRSDHQVPLLELASIALILLISPAAVGAGDPSAGEKVFARCAGCHSTAAGENKIGPSLAGVFGRKSGAEAGFNYSPALKNANITWDESTLDKFLENPSGFVHGTRMFINVSGADDRRNLIGYLKTLGK